MAFCYFGNDFVSTFQSYWQICYFAYNINVSVTIKTVYVFQQRLPIAITKPILH